MDNLSEHAEEILEALWIQGEDRPGKPLDLGIIKDDPACQELSKLNFIKVIDGHIILLDKGRKQAELAIRRHRLSERLMTDIFDVKKEDVDSISCKFEHLLHKGLEDKVCALLGHPRLCPHGKNIPRGECCKNKKKQLGVLISPLADLRKNEEGKIAYLHTKDPLVMQKLMSLGVLPGLEIKVMQHFPSCVFKIGHSQFAIDKELALSIYVRGI
ncbi:MAG: metal-dependent transcriptional regulator [Candidatus Omnitrophota bacterium]